MKFRTEILPAKFQNLIEHSENILTIGSCFAENIGEYFKYHKFNVESNPFGVLYNPASILNSLKILKEQNVFTNEDLVFKQGEWHSFYHHSDFSHHDREVCLTNINKKIEQASKFIANADRIIITYGTSFVYNYIERAVIVSNCHKIPQSKFTRLRLSLDEIVELIYRTVELLNEIKSNIKIIFTVSPVRHWKDGAIDNQLSKAQLLLAVNRITVETENCEYFPSYEIMMDDLRDYRFYESDLIHPNKIATDYIWEKFSESVLSEKANKLCTDIAKIVKSKNHRIRNSESEKTKKFAEDNLKLIRDLADTNSHLNLQEEEEYFSNFI